EPTTQDYRAVFRGLAAPRRPCLVRSFDCPAGLGGTHAWDRAQLLSRGGILHLDGVAVHRVGPGTVDIALLSEEFGAFEVQHGKVVARRGRGGKAPGVIAVSFRLLEALQVRIQMKRTEGSFLCSAGCV